MPVQPITSYDEFKQIINCGKVVAIDFWATWCGPCRMISPLFESHSEKIEGIEFYKVDVDEQAEIAQEMNIKAMPTFLILRDGKVLDQLVGASSNGLETLLVKAQGF